MAEREGFEPSVRFHVHTLSRRAPSTTRTSLHKMEIYNIVRRYCKANSALPRKTGGSARGPGPAAARGEPPSADVLGGGDRSFPRDDRLQQRLLLLLLQQLLHDDLAHRQEILLERLGVAHQVTGPRVAAHIGGEQEGDGGSP